MKLVSRWLFDVRPWCVGLSAVLAVSAVALSSAVAVPPATSLVTSVPAEGGLGTIKGRLVWGGAEAPAPKVLAAQGKADKDSNICAKDAPIISQQLVVDPKTKGVRNGFAYLVKPKGTPATAVKEIVTKTPTVEIDQKNCEYIPHVLAVAAGQSVVFKSSEAVNHNVHFNSFSNGFNQLLAPNGKFSKKLPAEKRPVKLTCDLHGWMDSYIAVFDHPYYAVTNEDGSFEIKNVPAGAQKLIVWQEQAGYVNQGLGAGLTVQVPAGGIADVGELKLNPAKVKDFKVKQ